MQSTAAYPDFAKLSVATGIGRAAVVVHISICEHKLVPEVSVMTLKPCSVF